MQLSKILTSVFFLHLAIAIPVDHGDTIDVDILTNSQDQDCSRCKSSVSASDVPKG